jgi:hypothetical protein
MQSYINDALKVEIDLTCMNPVIKNNTVKVQPETIKVGRTRVIIYIRLANSYIPI